MNKSELYQTIAVSSGFFTYTLGFVEMNILTPSECFAFGTIFILLAFLRNSIDKRTKKTQVSTNELASKITQLDIKENIRIENRRAKIKIIAQRVYDMILESEIFYQEFFAKYCNNESYEILKKNKTEPILSKEEAIKLVKGIFKSITMLNDSDIIQANNKALSELQYFHMQIIKVYSESNSILKHYGDVDHILISQVDGIRNQSKMFVENLPLLKHVNGGIAGVFGEKTPDQWAGLFANFYYIQLNCQYMCRKTMR